MWYEVVPSFCIITAALGLPGWGLYHIHNLTLGNDNPMYQVLLYEKACLYRISLSRLIYNFFGRSLLDRWDRHTFQRDIRLNDNPYKPIGLDALPDK